MEEALKAAKGEGQLDHGCSVANPNGLPQVVAESDIWSLLGVPSRMTSTCLTLMNRTLGMQVCLDARHTPLAKEFLVIGSAERAHKLHERAMPGKPLIASLPPVEPKANAHLLPPRMGGNPRKCA